MGVAVEVGVAEGGLERHSVNEAARVQESAEPHTTLVTKQLVERLDAREAEALRIDLDQVRFRFLSELTTNEKARRDAGTLPVFSLHAPAAGA